MQQQVIARAVVPAGPVPGAQRGWIRFTGPVLLPTARWPGPVPPGA